jgi:hypothetical protein
MDTHIINLSSYVKPKVIEDKRKDWVAYGDDNNYYQYLIDLFVNSTTNGAIINGISSMIYGKGIDALDSSSKPDQYAAMKSIFSNSCMRKVVLDFKMLGEGSFQVLRRDGRVVSAEHFPRQTLRAEKMNDKGEIEAYYYHPKWNEVKPNDKPKRIAAFGFGNGKEPEIKMIKRYISGYDYYCPQDYETSYAELECEISDYLINDVKNGFSGTKVVNFNNGTPDMEQQLRIKNDVMNKLTGSKGEKVIIAFNNNQESKTTVDDLALNDAPSHYEYLSRECQNKLIIAHRVTSPLLLGMRTENNGLGSNADEIKTASLLFNNVTIRPYQDMICEAMDDILAVNDISLKLYFKTLQPLEFIDTDNAITDEAREEETGVKLSSDDRPFLDDDTANDLWEIIKDLGEDENLEDYELIDVEDAEDEPEDFDVEEYLNGLNLSATQESTQDDKRYKVRYKYVKGTTKKPKGDSRPFCQNMMKNGKIFRKEDIGQMSARGVNKKHGHKGQNYSLFKWQGGVNCHHRWERRIYKKRLKKDGTEWGGNALDGTKFVNVSQAVREGFKLPKNPKEVSEANITRTDRGHHPNYKG